MENVCETLHDVRDHCDAQRLEGCLIQRVDLGVLEFDEYEIEHVRFKDVGLTGVGFRCAFVHQSSFNTTSLRGSSFTTSHLRETHFFTSELIESAFVGALLEGVRFFDSRLQNSKFGGSRILNSRFNGTDLSGVDFERAMLMHTSFSDERMENAQLPRANFSKAVLVDVDLRGANLFGADFSDALLIKVDLRDANVAGANFAGARVLSVAMDRTNLDENQRAQLAPAESERLQDRLRQQDSIEMALNSKSKEELIGMMSQLMKSYVIDGVAPQKADVGRVHVPQHLRGLSFASLMETLKFHLDVRELEKFTVSNGQVSVRLGETDYALTGSTTPPRAAAPVSVSPEAERSAPAPEPAPQTPETTPPETAVPPAPPSDAEVDNRFRMLEFD